MKRTVSKILFLLSVIAYIVNDVDSVCSFQSCPESKSDKINVHIVPYCVEELYLKYDDVIATVQANKQRRFTFSEVSTFWEWWNKQNDKTKATVTSLLNNGQIEFSSGGWTMNDEAVTNYQSTTDQITWGLRKLNDTFGKCGQPRVGWQYGVIGHSRQMANIFNHLGFDAAILGSIGFDAMKSRTENNSLEFIWQGSTSLGLSSDIFTSVVFEELNKFKTILEEKGAKQFFDQIQKAAQHYSTNNILVPIGTDQKTDPASTYRNIDLLFGYKNRNPNTTSKYSLFYSTPSCYIQAVNNATKGIIKGSIKVDDFIPYSNDSDHHFTGYYTSNPSLKRFERLGNNLLQICKQLGSLASPQNLDKIDTLRQAMGDVQRQDGISGAGCKEMQDQYPRELYKGFVDCLDVVQEALKILTKNNGASYEDCTIRRNISECLTSEKNRNFIVTTYNAMSQPRTKYVNLPVLGNAYRVRGPDGVELPTQISPLHFFSIAGRNGKSTKQLVFPATDIPPMGFKTFFVERIDNEDDDMKPYKPSNVSELGQGSGFKFDNNTGLLTHFFSNNITVNFTQRFYTNKDLSSYPLDNKTTRQFASFIFDPEELPTEVQGKIKFLAFQGPLVQELHQIFNKYIKSVFRVYTNTTGIEVQWYIGPIPKNGRGTDVFAKFITPTLASNTSFYTDTNGREQLLRHKTKKSSPTETEAASYYPTTSLINFKDDDNNVEFGVLIDRAQGGTLLKDGEIEMMLDRRFAVEPKNSPPKREDYAEGISHIVMGNTKAKYPGEKTSKDLLRTMIEKLLYDTWFFVSPTNNLTYEDYKNQYSMSFQGLKKPLPTNIKVMTLEPWKDKTILLRLNDIIPTGVDPELTEPEQIDIKDLFSTFKIRSIKETTLGANQWIEQNQKLKFKAVIRNSTSTKFRNEVDVKLQNYMVTLYPMQIRTFVVEVSRNT